MPAEQIARLCPVCGSGAFVEALRKQELRLVRCKHCGMIFTNPIDEDWASGLSYDKLAVPYYLSADKLESDYAPVRFERELKLFRRFCHKGSVLDIGCSTGAFLYQLKNRYPEEYEVLGIDVAGPALEYAQQKGVPVLRDSFLSHDFGGKQFSCVTFWAVLEHLNQPRDFLTKAVSVLGPGGLVFILVPNFRSLAVRILGAKYRYIFPQHINYFSLATLEKLGRYMRSLESVYTGSCHFNPLVILQDWKRGASFVPDEERARLLRRTTGFKQSPLLKPLKQLLAAVEGCLGKLMLADNLVLVLRNSQN